MTYTTRTPANIQAVTICTDARTCCMCVPNNGSILTAMLKAKGSVKNASVQKLIARIRPKPESRQALALAQATARYAIHKMNTGAQIACSMSPYP